jgi:ABC-2 type transport system ATP-binding protein
VITVTNLEKSYGPVKAVSGVSFHVGAGEVVGLLGPNGAGKTTLMKMLTGFLQADSGTVTIDGLDVVDETLEVQKRIGYLLENAPLYPEASVQSHLKMIADLRRVPKSDQPRLISRAVRAASLEEHLTRPIGQLSKGFRQRVGLAQSILHDPKVLILDEPTVGLDPTQIVESRRLIKRLAENTTILLSTHILSEVEAVCDRAIVLLNGQVRADARLAELAATDGAILVLDESAADATADLLALDEVQAVEPGESAEGRAYRVLGLEHADLRPAIYALAREKNWPLRELSRDLRTLERVFNDLVASSGDTDDETEVTDVAPDPSNVEIPPENGNVNPTEDDAGSEEEL